MVLIPPTTFEYTRRSWDFWESAHLSSLLTQVKDSLPLNVLDELGEDIYTPLRPSKASVYSQQFCREQLTVNSSKVPRKSNPIRMWFDDISDRFFDMDMDLGSRYRRPFGLGSRLRREFGMPRDVLSSTNSSSKTSSSVSNDSDKRLALTKDGLQMNLNVYQFSPNEITVKTVDNVIIIEGKHEEKQDEHGYVTRQFNRRYKLPKEYDPKDVVSTMSSDGVLTIRAPAIHKAAETVNERVVTIQQTGPASPPVKEESSEDAPKETKIPIKEEMN